MAKSEIEGVLVEAAMELERELQRLENLADAANQGRLNSDKTIKRVAGLLGQVGDSKDRFEAALQGLLAAMGGVRDRQVASLQKLAERAEQVRERYAAFSQLQERLEDLGKAGADLNAILAPYLARRDAEPGAGEAAHRPSEPEIERALERMKQAADDAKSLAGAAKESDFPEVAQQAESVRQQILAARNKLSLWATPPAGQRH